VIAAITNSVTYLHADGSSPTGNATGSAVTSGPGGANGPNPLTLTYQIDATGRGVCDERAKQYGFLYVVSPNKFAWCRRATNRCRHLSSRASPTKLSC